MIHNLRLALAQMNLTVGDIAGNTSRIIDYLDKARAERANLILIPELAITGYPPEDLVLRNDFVEANRQALEKVAQATQGLLAIVGFVEREGESLFNAAAVCADGRVLATYRKICLPNYGVFDEKRYFHPGYRPLSLHLDKLRIGVTICEDIWVDGVTECEASIGEAHLVVNISASPYHQQKGRARESLFAERARRNKIFLAYANTIGGQDELVFDGQSFVFDPEGRLLLRGKQFEEQLLVCDLMIDTQIERQSIRLNDTVGLTNGSAHLTSPQSYVLQEVSIPVLEMKFPSHASAPMLFSHYAEEEEVFHALVLGTRDYVRKNGFRKVVLGLSGGIDSALTAVIAVEAIGKENVTGVLMPSRFTITASVEDGLELVKNLGIHSYTIPINEAVAAMEKLLSRIFADCERDMTEENLQARVRGMILMALSNKFGWLVLTTGNKSEVAVGYATLYGDMAGGLGVLKDVPKTFVYRLANWINQTRFAAKGGVIPQRTISRPPSAELRPDQTDQDSLPPYDVLDRIIEAYMEDDQSITEMAASGLPETIVCDAVKMIDRAEYKRRQAAPGIKITPRNFGKDRRMPITNRFQPCIKF